jgi:hypothetical protein
MPLPTRFQIVVGGAIAGAAIWALWKISRLNDPMDYASLHVGHEPRISLARFRDVRHYDPVSYDAGIAAVSEFSREYQSSFLAETDPATVVRAMTRSRRAMHREFHAFRQWLPNDAPLERRILAGIEDVDAAMVVALADVAARFPCVKLYYGAGMTTHPTLRAADDTWL